MAFRKMESANNWSSLSNDINLHVIQVTLDDRHGQNPVDNAPINCQEFYIICDLYLVFLRQ